MALRDIGVALKYLSLCVSVLTAAIAILSIDSSWAQSASLKLLSSNPANNATNVQRTVTPTLNFSTTLDRTSVSLTRITLRNSTGAVTVSLSVSGSQLKLIPSSTLASQVRYTISASGMRGINGEQLAAPISLQFTTGSASAAPPVPTGIAATAGNAQVNLRWSTSSGATGYKVMRSLANGGPYSQFGTPTTNAYVDYSVNNDTPYYYVVAASNSAGTSAYSAQVSAEPNVSTPPPLTTGTWINVTPAGVDLTNNLSCGNYGTDTVQADPAHPSNLYTQFHCQGIWKSTDYGATWSGPINKGSNGVTVGDCAGGITIPPSSTASVPTIYLACGRGAGIGFWKSTDGGVNWTRYTVTPSGNRQDYYPPAVDPYDPNHLIMAGHEMNSLVQSIDGGRTWTNVPTAGGMQQNAGTAAIFFINTGSATSTRGTWLWMAQQSGGGIGTWRTTNSGATWTQVDKNEHPHGAAQIYQPNNGGVVYMAGAYSSLGWGVLRSANFGQTWTHVGMAINETVVVGTPKNVYAMYGYPVGPGGSTDAGFQTSPQPGTSSWIAPGTPASLTQGPAQIAVVNDGTHNILVGAMWNSGLWRYIEP